VAARRAGRPDPAADGPARPRDRHPHRARHPPMDGPRARTAATDAWSRQPDDRPDLPAGASRSR
jgi:hypothetical protein